MKTAKDALEFIKRTAEELDKSTYKNDAGAAWMLYRELKAEIEK